MRWASWARGLGRWTWATYPWTTPTAWAPAGRRRWWSPWTRRCSSDLPTRTLGLNRDLPTFSGRNTAACLLAFLVQVDLKVFHESKLYPLFYHLQVGRHTCVMLGLCWNIGGVRRWCYDQTGLLSVELRTEDGCSFGFYGENLVIFHFRPHCPSPTSFFLSDPFVKTVNVTHAVHCNHKQYVITLNIQHACQCLL